MNVFFSEHLVKTKVLVRECLVFTSVGTHSTFYLQGVSCRPFKLTAYLKKVESLDYLTIITLGPFFKILHFGYFKSVHLLLIFRWEAQAQ